MEFMPGSCSSLLGFITTTMKTPNPLQCMTENLLRFQSTLVNHMDIKRAVELFIASRLKYLGSDFALMSQRYEIKA
jgi:hypothetical protein